MRTRTAIPTLLLLAAACAPPPPPPPDVPAIKAAIEAANKKQADAFLKGDAAGAAGNYTADAVVMMSGAPPMHGSAEVTKALTGMFAEQSAKDVKLSTLDVMVSGDMAVETGSYLMTMVPKKGKPATDSGSYVTTWKKQADGSWKIVRDINTTSIPPKQ